MGARERISQTASQTQTHRQTDTQTYRERSDGVALQRQHMRQETDGGVTVNKEDGNERVSNGDACYGLVASGRLSDWWMRGRGPV